MLVVDASVVAPAIADGSADGDASRRLIVGRSLAAPDLVRVEAMSALRRQLAAGSLTSQQAGDAVDDLLDLRITLYPTVALLRRCWELRDNVTPYDGCYVALAEALDCPLATADKRLAAAPGPRCAFETL